MPKSKLRKGVKEKLYRRLRGHTFEEEYRPWGYFNKYKVASKAKKYLLRYMGKSTYSFLEKEWKNKFTEEAIKHFMNKTLPEIKAKKYFDFLKKKKLYTKILANYCGTLESIVKQSPLRFEHQVFSKRPWLVV